jgi:hypothetical protein
MFKKRFFKKGDDESTSNIETLISMGFTSSQAKHALDTFDNNLERATNYLLSNQSDDDTHNTPNIATSRNSIETEDEQLQRIMAESIVSEQRRAATAPRGNTSAASIRAGQAAASRAENANRRFGTNGKVIAKKENKKKSIQKTSYTSSNTTAFNQPSSTSVTNMLKPGKGDLKDHPNVKMPTQMKDKSKEEQILRCAKRIAPHPLAVDTLLRAFVFIRENPDNVKYRKIDKSSMGFRNVLEGKPGVTDLIQAMNFVPSHSNPMNLILNRNQVDMALLYLGISALEQMRKSDEYISKKLILTFEKELIKIRNGENAREEEEVLRRAAFVSKLPSEPELGAGALMQVTLGEDKIMRKFDGDDMLRDVVYWIGGHGSAIPEKIHSREWCLVDLNRYPVVPIDTEILMNKTLQFIGCWPSGMLALQPSSVEWKENKELVQKPGSSRGLGALS